MSSTQMATVCTGRNKIDQIRQELGWARRALVRRWLGQSAEPDEWQALSAYGGLVHQAWLQRPLAPQIVSDVWHSGHFNRTSSLPPFFTPFRREREASSHHYGHDIQIKRHAGLPLVGQPLPFLLEHGLKVSREAQFETPRGWSRGGYLCMGELRAQWLRERFDCPAHAIGPWILYARSLLEADEISTQRQNLGRCLLVVLAHSWDQVERHMDLQACITTVQQTAREYNYTQVIWLRHWLDPTDLPLPLHWLQACNGHRSNPWFLDSLRTLIELSDGLISNAFGTHVGYAAALGKELYWIPDAAEEDRSRLAPAQAFRARREWEERTALSAELQKILQQHGHHCDSNAPLRALLNPFWGFDRQRSPSELRKILCPQSTP